MISMKSLFLAAATAAAVAIGVWSIQQGQDSSEPVLPDSDPMTRAAQIVRENMAKPCAEELARQSSIMLTEPGLVCK